MTPTEQAAQERDPLYIPDRDIEARIKDVEYRSLDYGNCTACRLTFDNGMHAIGTCTRADDDIGRTAAYRNAILTARPMLQWMLAEHNMWLKAQTTDEGMLIVLGQTGGE